MKAWQSSATKAGYALYALYALYAIAGAVAQKMGTALPFRLGDVGEFCLFFVATILFVAGFIQEDSETALTGWLSALNENAERYAMLVFYVFVCMVIVQEVLRPLCSITHRRGHRKQRSTRSFIWAMWGLRSR